MVLSIKIECHSIWWNTKIWIIESINFLLSESNFCYFTLVYANWFYLFRTRKRIKTILINVFRTESQFCHYKKPKGSEMSWNCFERKAFGKKISPSILRFGSTLGLLHSDTVVQLDQRSILLLYRCLDFILLWRMPDDCTR